MTTKIPNTTSVLAEEINNKGILTLNRPEILNAVNLEMAEKVFIAVKKWQETKSMIIIKGNGRAFSSGSDLKKLILPSEYDVSIQFAKVEYTLNHFITTLKIPYVSLIDGVIMGGGVGYSIHGKYRIATENTVFAMPETLIGAFPDIGSSYFLPRLQGKLGYYLGLTGSRVHGTDNLHAGIATHYCESVKLPALERALIDLENAADIDKVLDEFCPKPNAVFSLEKNLEQINKCFSADSIEEILRNLEEDGSNWAKDTIKILRMASPRSLKITLHQLNLGAKYSLAECLQMEFRIVHRLIKCSEFHEGVRARLIRKDNNPQWDPVRLEDVSYAEHILPFFQPLPNNDRLPINDQLMSKF